MGLYCDYSLNGISDQDEKIFCLRNLVKTCMRKMHFMGKMFDGSINIFEKNMFHTLQFYPFCSIFTMMIEKKL